MPWPTLSLRPAASASGATASATAACSICPEDSHRIAPKQTQKRPRYCGASLLRVRRLPHQEA
jgi:hypothetical protein